MTADEIFDKAYEQCNIAPVRSGSYREGLEVLTEAITRDHFMTSALRENLAESLTANLVARLQVDDYICCNPGVRQEVIRKPVVVLGLPRTGTTLLSHLLGTDPARRSLLNWEVADPIPPATTSSLSSDPRCLRKRMAQHLILALDPRLARAHWEFAEDPTECDSLLLHEFKSAHWAILIPEYCDWLCACEMDSAYAYHKSVLQVFQSATHGNWNLKSVSHGLFLTALRKAYPDARLIWIHRDPFKALASACSLIRAQQAMLGAQIQLSVIGQRCEAFLTELLARSLAAIRQLPDRSVYHLSYSQFVQSPIEAMRELYRWLEDDFTEEIGDGMRRWLCAHPQGKYGKHQYSLEEFNISESSLPDIFHDYMMDCRIDREI